MFGLDDKQDKLIADRMEWITLCAQIIILKIAAYFKIELPPPPTDSAGEKTD